MQHDMLITVPVHTAVPLVDVVAGASACCVATAAFCAMSLLPRGACSNNAARDDRPEACCIPQTEPGTVQYDSIATQLLTVTFSALLRSCWKQMLELCNTLCASRPWPFDNR